MHDWLKVVQTVRAAYYIPHKGEGARILEKARNGIAEAAAMTTSFTQYAELKC